MNIDKKSGKAVWAVYLLWLMSLVFVLVGPVWCENTPYRDTAYYKQTRDNLEKAEFLEGEGELSVGYDREVIHTESGQPIMGFSDRSPLASTGKVTPLYATAITAKVGAVAVTIVGVDVMLLAGPIIEDIYRETGLRREEIYFTATHTHSGLGGWFEHPVFELFYGSYSQKYYEWLRDAIVKAIQKSRQNYRPARLKYTRVEAGEWLEDRIYKDQPPEADSGFHGVNPYLTGVSFVSVEDPNKTFATLVSYAAHATVVRKDVHEFSRDYPGVVCDELQRSTGAECVLFAAGSVGDARAVYLHQSGAEKLGKQLVERLAPEIERTSASAVTSLRSMWLPVVMPAARFAFLGPHSSVFPLLAAGLFENQVYISYLQLGEFVLIGMPVDIAGELTKELQDAQPVLVTSFNGGWKGYATKEDTYLQRNTYSTREMGISGPQAGAFLMDIAGRIYAKGNK